jgi:hypothetical protein
LRFILNREDVWYRREESECFGQCCQQLVLFCDTGDSVIGDWFSNIGTEFVVRFMEFTSGDFFIILMPSTGAVYQMREELQLGFHS